MADAKKQSEAELAAAFGANKGAPAAIDMPGDGSGPRELVSPKPGADLEPVKDDADEGVPGGRYLVGGVLVDAEGKPLSDKGKGD